MLESGHHFDDRVPKQTDMHVCISLIVGQLADYVVHFFDLKINIHAKRGVGVIPAADAIDIHGNS